MTGCLLVCCLAAETVCDAGVPEPPGTVIVLAGSPAYVALPGNEVGPLAGVIARRSSVEPGAGYVLVGASVIPGHAEVKVLFAPGKAHLLEPLVGKQVLVTGKQEGGRLWVGTIEVGRPADRAGPDGIVARAPLRLGELLRPGVGVVVARNAEDLAQAMQIRGETAGQTAAARLARGLRVPRIDWDRQMVVALLGSVSPRGETLRVVRASVQGRELVVTYVLQVSGQGGFTLPAETILVPRFDGAVRLRQSGLR